MIIYRITRRDPHEGTMYRWANTQAQAIEFADEFDQDFGGHSSQIDAIQIDTRDALVAWLNINFTRDNG